MGACISFDDVIVNGTEGDEVTTGEVTTDEVTTGDGGSASVTTEDGMDSDVPEPDGTCSPTDPEVLEAGYGFDLMEWDSGGDLEIDATCLVKVGGPKTFTLICSDAEHNDEPLQFEFNLTPDLMVPLVDGQAVKLQFAMVAVQNSFFPYDQFGLQDEEGRLLMAGFNGNPYHLQDIGWPVQFSVDQTVCPSCFHCEGWQQGVRMSDGQQSLMVPDGQQGVFTLKGKDYDFLVPTAFNESFGALLVVQG